MKKVYYIFLLLIAYAFHIQSQVQNNGNLRILNGSKIGFFGDFTNNGLFTNNIGSVYLAGGSHQLFNGTNIISVDNLIINKTSSSLQLENIIEINGVCSFFNGIIYTTPANRSFQYVSFLPGSSLIGVSDTSHVAGVVRKTGNTAFTFPVGNSVYYKPIAMSSPSSISDVFTAEYFDQDPDPQYNRSLKDSSINHISSCEYWTLDRTTGVSDVSVILSWDENSCFVDNLFDLIVTRWNGNKWKDHGNGGTTGSTSAGTVTTSSPVTSFSPFTLASRTGSNPLPAAIMDFNVKYNDESMTTSIQWKTHSEINNDFFTVERSSDGITFDSIAFIHGAGNSSNENQYISYDRTPLSGISYYRIRQTDFDGYYSFSETKTLLINGQTNSPEILLFPNPSSNGRFFITPVQKGSYLLSVYDVFGKTIYSDEIYFQENQATPYYFDKNLNSGSYIIVVKNDFLSWTKVLLVK